VGGVLACGGDGRWLAEAFDRGDELGEVAVADDTPELLLGLQHPGGSQALAHVAVLPALTLRWV